MEYNVGSMSGVSVRAARPSDRAAREQLVRDSFVEYDLPAFLLFFFQEATLEACVLGGAVMFIFVGAGLAACLALVPALAACLASGVALQHRAAASRHAARMRSELGGVVAQSGARVVGSASLAPCRGERGAAWLQHVGVARAWRRRGVARALLAECEAAARRAGRPRLHALLSDLHVAPRALLVHMQWRVVSAGARPVLGVLELPLARLCRDLPHEHDAPWRDPEANAPTDAGSHYSMANFQNS